MSEHDQVEDMDFMAGIMEARELIDDAGPGDRAIVDDLISRNNGG
jgi:molecular chaperone HscB